MEHIFEKKFKFVIGMQIFRYCKHELLAAYRFGIGQ